MTKKRIDNALILDLDDTIFKTRSMDSKLFIPFFDHLALSLRPEIEESMIQAVIEDLWGNTWDKVLDKYKIPVSRIQDSLRLLEHLELNLSISPYPDYALLKELSNPKFLVTTSLTSLQQSKIKALNIENDFERIIINDTFRETRSKLDIFKELVAEYALVPETTYVIGDNPSSEIEAGNQLNMITVQILREGVTKGMNARHYIHSFEELIPLISKR